jgi:hypothetical protein
LLDPIIAADVGLPFIADRVRVGGDSAFGSGEGGARLEAASGGIFALALGAIIEPDRAGTVLVAVVVEQRITEPLSLGDGVAVDVTGANGGADESRGRWAAGVSAVSSSPPRRFSAGLEMR